MTESNEATTIAPSKALSFALSCSRHFPGWLIEQKVNLAFTTYQAGKVFFIGSQPGGRLSFFERSFERCLGLCATDQTLWLSSIYQLWRLENVLEPGRLQDGYDRLFVPRLGYVTGDLDIHDIACDALGEPIFVNTLFSCLARPSATHSFTPVWKPPFVSRLAAEDRCHLNGLAMQDGKPAFVTAVAKSDVADGWRDHRRNGGIVINVADGEVITSGLSMPRWHDGRLWLLDSGTGRFGHVDRATGRFESIAFCPGYARGLSIVKDFAIIGLSRPPRPYLRGIGSRRKSNCQRRRAALRHTNCRSQVRRHGTVAQN